MGSEAIATMSRNGVNYGDGAVVMSPVVFDELFSGSSDGGVTISTDSSMVGYSGALIALGVSGGASGAVSGTVVLKKDGFQLESLSVSLSSVSDGSIDYVSLSSSGAENNFRLADSVDIDLTVGDADVTVKVLLGKLPAA